MKQGTLFEVYHSIDLCIIDIGGSVGASYSKPWLVWAYGMALRVMVGSPIREHYNRLWSSPLIATLLNTK